jgi:hypothetical protein
MRLPVAEHYIVAEKGQREPWGLLRIDDDENVLWASKGVPVWRDAGDNAKYIFEPDGNDRAFQVSEEKFEKWREKLGIPPLPDPSALAAGSVETLPEKAPEVRDMTLPNGTKVSFQQYTDWMCSRVVASINSDAAAEEKK